MSNHGPIDDAVMQAKMSEFMKQFGLGATGRFPEGKLTPKDEGEIRIAIGTEQDKVIINFGKEVAWIGFTPEQAKSIARLLSEKADGILNGGLKAK